MSSISCTFYVERGDEEIALTVHATVSAFVAADFWSPAEGGEVEITAVLLDGAPWTGELTVAETRRVEEQLSDDDSDDCQDEEDPFDFVGEEEPPNAP